MFAERWGGWGGEGVDDDDDDDDNDDDDDDNDDDDDDADVVSDVCFNCAHPPIIPLPSLFKPKPQAPTHQPQCS